MAYAGSDRAGQGAAPVAIKILIAGGFGAGKTTLVGSVTEIRPLRTEEPLSEPGTLLDSTDGVERKTTTTVALDFGRITIRDNLVIYLFGTPGQERFWFMWDELTRGALGAIVLADTRRVGAKTTTTVAMDFGRISFPSGLVLYLFGTPGQERFWFMWDELSIGAIGAVVLADTQRVADCFASIDYFEHHGMPFVVAVNCFDGAPRFDPDDIRIALSLGPGVPIVLCDARDRDSVKHVLVSLVRYVMSGSRRPDRMSLG